MSRMKAWTLAKLRVATAHATASNDNTFKVQINVDVAEVPGRVIFGRVSPDEADAIADRLRATAAEARAQTERWQAQLQLKGK